MLGPRDNANGMRAKGGRGRTVPVRAPLMRLYADYLNREYGAVDSDYVLVNLWAAPAGRPMTYPAAYDLVTRLRAATGIAFSPHSCRHTCPSALPADPGKSPLAVGRGGVVAQGPGGGVKIA